MSCYMGWLTVWGRSVYEESNDNLVGDDTAAESSLNLKEQREKERKRILEPEGRFEDLDSLFLFRQMHERTAGLPGRSRLAQVSSGTNGGLLEVSVPCPLDTCHCEGVQGTSGDVLHSGF